MEEIVVKHVYTDHKENTPYKDLTFSIDGKEVVGRVDGAALNPLRFLEHELVKRGIQIKKLISSNDPWSIEELTIQYNEYEEIERLLTEIMDYRCHFEGDLDWNEIIRQLPFNMVMKVSDDIMNYGKDPNTILDDIRKSDEIWRGFADEVRYTCGEEYARKYRFGNPNETEDILFIPKDEPQKRKHLIYRSSRGGYNIKTQSYNDRSVEHYCFHDSRSWD